MRSATIRWNPRSRSLVWTIAIPSVSAASARSDSSRATRRARSTLGGGGGGGPLVPSFMIGSSNAVRPRGSSG